MTSAYLIELNKSLFQYCFKQIDKLDNIALFYYVIKEVHTTKVQFLSINLRIGWENNLESTYLLQKCKK